MTQTAPTPTTASRPRIGIAGIAIESSTFTPYRSSERDFEVCPYLRVTWLQLKVEMEIWGGQPGGIERAEAEERKAAGVPPYGRLVGIVLSSPELDDVNSLGMAMARKAEPLRAIGAQVFGPAPAPIARIRGRHRVRLLIKAEKTAPVQAAVTAWLAQFTWPARVRVQVDVDPLSFF